MDPGWKENPAYQQLKLQKRLVRTADGQVEILAQAPSIAPMYASSYVLNTQLTGSITEPKGQYGTDDAQNGYYDWNYWKFCGPGATTVALYYWLNSNWITDQANNYHEPVNRGSGYYANPYFTSASNGHAGIMIMAEYERPATDSWPYTGLMTWQYTYSDGNFGTPINRIHDALNWETTSPQSTSGFYLVQPSGSSLTRSFLQTAAHDDIGNSHVPFVVAVNTYLSSSEHLPQWTHSIWHYVTVIGYNDTSSTFTIIDTCGASCSDKGPYGVNTISQQTLTDLINAIPASSGGGIVW
jgi:hypothetical protein